MRSLRRILKELPGFQLIQGGWPDEARAVVQLPVFRQILEGYEVAGVCLNAGSGEGLFVPFLDSFSSLSRIVHLDSTTRLLASLPESRHQTAVGSLTNIPYRDDEFDFVFCTEVLEHVEDDKAAFREIGRVLRRFGLVLISTPTPPAPPDPAHAREGYNLNDLRERLAAAGIELLSHAFCMHCAMRLLLMLWRWQYERAGRQKSWMPRAVILLLAYVDRWFPIGCPFDIIVLGRKN